MGLVVVEKPWRPNSTMILFAGPTVQRRIARTRNNTCISVVAAAITAVVFRVLPVVLSAGVCLGVAFAHGVMDCLIRDVALALVDRIHGRETSVDCLHELRNGNVISVLPPVSGAGNCDTHAARAAQHSHDPPATAICILLFHHSTDVMQTRWGNGA